MTVPNTTPTTDPLDDERARLRGQIGIHRDAMLRFARRRVRDADLAEDAVQDAMLAALGAIDSFQGQSKFRTWLIGILDHKIQDAFRREGRYVRLHGDSDVDGDRESAAALVADTGWSADPLKVLAGRRFGVALQHEIDALPPTLGGVFRLQVLDDTPTVEVCRRLRITEANCWVRLHRARKRLAGRMVAHRA
jgi:RNA polymerase sigma-70 factor (ECF subfamily)